VTVKSQLVVLIPKTPGEASQTAINRYCGEKGLEPIIFGGPTQRTAHADASGEVCDIPSTLHSLLCLDNRTNEELVDAVDEFARLLEEKINDAESEVKGVVIVRRI
jgi:hypothetical protein